MYCSNCGSTVAEGSKFCNQCGASIQSNVIKQSFKSHKDDKCSFCGEILEAGELKCPSCGNRTKTGSNANPDLNLSKKETLTSKNIESSNAAYPNEEIEKSKELTMYPGEKVILKEDGFIYNESEEYEHVLVLTNKALIVLADKESSSTGDVIRIPFSQINQCVYHRGGFFADKYLELVTTGGIDRIDGSSRSLALWEMAINDRFNEETKTRGMEFYKNVNVKKLK